MSFCFFDPVRVAVMMFPMTEQASHGSKKVRQRVSTGSRKNQKPNGGGDERREGDVGAHPWVIGEAVREDRDRLGGKREGDGGGERTKRDGEESGRKQMRLLVTILPSMHLFFFFFACQSVLD